MGIQNLKKFIRSKYKQNIGYINISKFRTEKIVIDVSSYLYKYKISLGDKWKSAFVNMFSCLKIHKVHGIFVFDGQAPIEKLKEQQRRKGEKEKIKVLVESLKNDVDKYLIDGTISDLLKSTNDKIYVDDKVKNLMVDNKKDTIDVSEINEYINKRERQISPVLKQDFEDLKNLLTVFGIPYIQAEGEAEALCSYLCSVGKAKAVLSEDSDVLAYGTEYFMSGLDVSSGTCEFICLSELLKEMELNQKEFLDYCILCGTDFNDNIPSIGNVKAFDLIKQYRTIDSEIKNKKGFSIDYINVRSIFETFGRLVTKEYSIRYWESNIDFDKISQYLKGNEMGYMFNNICEDWKQVEIIFE
jgi:5'-3' exonuclease